MISWRFVVYVRVIIDYRRLWLGGTVGKNNEFVSPLHDYWEFMDRQQGREIIV